MTEVVVEDVRFYQLKQRDSDETAIVPSQPPNEQEGLKDFVLP